MTDQELLRLENILIKLHNEGKSLAEIQDVLSTISQSLVEQWYANLLNANSKIGPKPFKTIISAKDESGKYLYSNSLSFEMSMLEKVKFDLWRILSSSSADKNSEFYKQAQAANDTFSKYFVEVQYIEAEGKFNVNYSLNTDDPQIQEAARVAVLFYGNTFISYEITNKHNKLITESTPDLHSESGNILPISIKQVYIEDYLGIKSVHINSIPIDSHWIFITGENGYGKTAVLRAITIGLIGTREGDVVLLDERESTRISIEFKFENDNCINSVNTDSFTQLPLIACYGPSRLQLAAMESQQKVDQSKTISHSLFQEHGLLLNIEHELILWRLENTSRYEIVVKLFLELIPILSNIEVENNRDVYYIEKHSNAKGSGEVKVQFKHLASGIKSMISMIGDMLVRFYKTQNHVQYPSDFKGVVIIDELDLHWHPKWQKRLPTLLSKAFPNIQFIVTTHSVIPFLGAPSNSTFLKVDRSSGAGITVSKIELKIENLLPNILLTSALFEMDSIRQINNVSIDEVRTEDQVKQLKENLDAQDVITNIAAASQKYPDNLFN